MRASASSTDACSISTAASASSCAASCSYPTLSIDSMYVFRCRRAISSSASVDHACSPLVKAILGGSPSRVRGRTSTRVIMYYFCIVGTQDNPLYETDLTTRPTTSGTSNALPSSVAGTGAGEGHERRSTSGSGSIFGFGSALGALADGIGGSRMLMGGNAPEKSDGGNAGAERHMLQMIAHGSLDVIEDRQFVTNTMYLKSIDRINDWSVSAFLVPGSACDAYRCQVHYAPRAQARRWDPQLFPRGLGAVDKGVCSRLTRHFLTRFRSSMAPLGWQLSIAACARVRAGTCKLAR